MPHAVFVSHAHADNVVCRAYVAALRVHGIDVWYDESNLQAGHSLTTDIERELEARTAFIVMLTPAAVESYWVRLETGAFRSLIATDPTRLLLPVRLQSCSVPVLLRDTKWIDAVDRPVDQVISEIVSALSTPSMRTATAPHLARLPPPSSPPDIVGKPDTVTGADTDAEVLARARCREGFLIVTPTTVRIELRMPIGSRLIKSQAILRSTITRIETKVIIHSLFGLGGGMNITLYSRNGTGLRATWVSSLKKARALVALLEAKVSPVQQV